MAEEGSAGPGHKRPVTRRQAEKNAETRRRLLTAAADIVGRHGYAGASVARIAAAAGVAHGAFYLHFATRQALFDVLLPEVGGAMLEEISRAVHDAPSLAEVERRGLRANFDYLTRHPGLDRVLNEAEFFAPMAFRAYVDRMHGAYVRSLRRSMERGELRPMPPTDLDLVAAMLIGARSYILRLFARTPSGGVVPLSPDRVDTYVAAALHGIAVPRN